MENWGLAILLSSVMYKVENVTKELVILVKDFLTKGFKGSLGFSLLFIRTFKRRDKPQELLLNKKKSLSCWLYYVNKYIMKRDDMTNSLKYARSRKFEQNSLT